MPASGAVLVGLKKVYADPRFWRVAPLSASCIGTAWALQGLWAAQWLKDVDGFDRAEVVQHLFAMAVALSLGAILLGMAADRLRRRGVGPEVLLGFVAVVFIAAQFALILRLPLPSYLEWAVVAAVGAATVLSFAILAEYFPKELAGRANGALNLFHIAAAFAVQYATGVVVQQWMPEAGHYPEIAYQTAFALNLVLQIAAWIWFAMPRTHPETLRCNIACVRPNHSLQPHIPTPDASWLLCITRDALEPDAMSATRILWGQILIVLAIVLATMWAATQWVAWKLGYQPQLGQPWFELIPGVPIYLPPSFFWWWYAYDAYAPDVFVEGAIHRGVRWLFLDRGRHCHVGVAGARSQDRRDLRLGPLGDANGNSCRGSDRA